MKLNSFLKVFSGLQIGYMLEDKADSNNVEAFSVYTVDYEERYKDFGKAYRMSFKEVEFTMEKWTKALNPQIKEIVPSSNGGAIWITLQVTTNELEAFREEKKHSFEVFLDLYRTL